MIYCTVGIDKHRAAKMDDSEIDWIVNKFGDDSFEVEAKYVLPHSGFVILKNEEGYSRKVPCFIGDTKEGEMSL